MATPALSNNIFMHCTEMYLQVEEYKSVLEPHTRKTETERDFFKAEVPLYIKIESHHHINYN